MKPQPKQAAARRLLSNRAPGILTNRTTKGVFQRPFRSVFTKEATTPRWG